MFFILCLYNLLFPLLFLLYSPFYLAHIIKRGGLTREYWQRFGIWGRDVKKTLAALDNKVWIHAISVGETVVASSFIKNWQKAHPEDHIVLSCGTSTAYGAMKKKALPGVILVYCPFDFFWAIWHTLNVISPKTLIIFEVEIWPNMILQAAKRGIKVCLVNGRMSDNSSAGYAKWGFVFKRIFNAFSVICVQTKMDAERIERVTGRKGTAIVCDTMKFDQVPDVGAADVTPILNGCFGPEKRVVLVGGSTHPGEEELLCKAMVALKEDYPQLKLVLVPRHCERGNEVEAIVKANGLSCRLLKQPEGNQDPSRIVDVLIVNTTGELMNYFSAGDIAYVGKSMAGQTGGHNLIEPAIFGKAVIYGSHMENFRQVAEIFKARQASVEVEADEALETSLKILLEYPEKRRILGENARKTVETYRGAIDRTIRAIG